MIDFELFMHEILYVMTWKFFKCVKKHIYLRTKREVLWLQTENALWNSFTIWWELRSYHLLALLNVVPSKAFLTKMSLIILEILWYMMILLHQCSSTFRYRFIIETNILYMQYPRTIFWLLRNFTIAHA